MFSSIDRRIWSRQYPSAETKDLYTSILGIPNATLLDEGVYTCQVNKYINKHITSIIALWSQQKKLLSLRLRFTVNRSFVLQSVTSSATLHLGFCYSFGVDFFAHVSEFDAINVGENGGHFY